MKEGERNIIKDNGRIREGREDCGVVWWRGGRGKEGSGDGGGRAT